MSNVFGHFIAIHFVENLKDHNCLVLGEKGEIEYRHLVSLRTSPAEVRSRSDCSFVHGPKIAKFAMILAAKKYLVPLAMGTEFGKPEQTFQKCLGIKQVWSRGVVTPS